MNVKQALEDTARAMPDKKALILDNQVLTYGELDRISNKVANALKGFGVKKGTHVGILMSHTLEWVTNFFGVIKSGAVAVLLNPALKMPELYSLLQDSDSEVLITETAFRPALSPVVSHLVCLRHVLESDSFDYRNMIAESPSSPPGIPLEDCDEATIIYTSGVLGRQKGVIHTHGSLMGTPPIVSTAIRRRSEDIVIDLVRFSHLFGLCEVLLGSIITGSTIVLVPQFTPRAVLQAVEKERGTIIFGVPAMYNTLAMLPEETVRRYNLATLRLAVTAGAKSFPRLMKVLEDKFGLLLFEVYGLTETSAVSISTFASHRLGTVGKPICPIRVVDEEGKEVRRGEVGEAVFHAPWVMKGYYKAPELTAQVLRDGWFYTGDLVKMDEEGYLEYIEKKSFVVVTSSGLKIGPSEVEFVLLSHPGVAEAALVGIDDGYGGQIPTAFVVPKEGFSITAQELLQFCSHALADFKLPKRIQLVDSIPKTSSGKLDRKSLKEMGRSLLAS